MGSLGFEDLKKMGGCAEEGTLFYNLRRQDDVPDKDGSGLYYKKSSEYKERLPEGSCGMTYKQLSLLMMTVCRAQEEIWNETDLYMQ